MTENISSPNIAENSSKPAGLGRWQGITVFAAVALPIVAAYVVFYSGFGIPASTVNQGELLLPAHSVQAIELQDEGGKDFDFPAEKPLWRLLIVAGDKCAGECEKLLYTSRQVHIRLGDKAVRVERLLATGTPLAESRHAELEREHPKLRFFHVEPTQLDQWLDDSSHKNLKRPSALLIDQQGFAMMVYDNRHTGNQMLKDIKRLLKYSYEK